ncbi:hypothetical protein [uncultured Algibacter sp.]|uniref:hypothetical protein n=1 Tax=uncultured Algibacter sp. TaxID=298659 RepID=UPI00321640E1
MTLELIVFIASVLFGIFLYWRESQGNGLYRFLNKMFNSKALQMKSSNKKGFLYQQSFLLRLVFIGFLFLIGIVVTRFLIPIDIATISIFASMIVGTLAGTYIANFVFKSGEVIDEKSDSLEDMVHDTIEKGKDFIEDLKTEKPKTVKAAKEDIANASKPDEKSARERLKDKGLL